MNTVLKEKKHEKITIDIDAFRAIPFLYKEEGFN